MEIKFDNDYFKVTFKTKEEMKNILKNWKTTLLGVMAVVLAAAKAKNTGTVDAETISLILSGLAGVFAKDSDKTGVVTDKNPTNDNDTTSAGK